MLVVLLFLGRGGRLRARSGLFSVFQVIAQIGHVGHHVAHVAKGIVGLLLFELGFVDGELDFLVLALGLHKVAEQVLGALDKGVDVLDFVAGLEEGHVVDDPGAGRALGAKDALVVGLQELLDERVVGVDLEDLLLEAHEGEHGVGGGAALALDQLLKGAGPAELAGQDGERGGAQLGVQADLGDVRLELRLEEGEELFEPALRLLRDGRVRSVVLGDVQDLLLLVLVDGGEEVLVDRVRGVDELLAGVLFQKGRLFDGRDALAVDKVDRVAVLVALDVLVQRRLLLLVVGGGELDDLQDLGAVRLAADALVLEVDRVRLEEGVHLVVLQAADHLKELAGDGLADGGQRAAALEGLARDVHRNVLKVDHAAHKGERVRQVVLVADKDVAGQDADVLVRLLGLEQVDRARSGNVEEALEHHVALGLEVDPPQRLTRVLKVVLVELNVLFLFDFVRRTHPERLLGIQQLQLFLVLLLLLFLFLFSLSILLLFSLSILRLFSIFLLLFHYFNNLLQVNRKGKEAGILLRQRPDRGNVQELVHALLDVEDNASPALGKLRHGRNGERGRRVRSLPHMARLLCMRLAEHFHIVCNDKGRVEANTKLTNHIGVLPLF